MRSELIERIVAHAGGIIRSRSSVLVPLQWTSLILVLFLLLFVIARAPVWIEIGIFVLLALVLLLLFAAYLYFMLRDPDALRSEKHALSKYAIDKGLYGDSDMGMLEVPRLGGEFLLPAEFESSANSQLSGPSEERQS